MSATVRFDFKDGNGFSKAYSLASPEQGKTRLTCVNENHLGIAPERTITLFFNEFVGDDILAWGFGRVFRKDGIIKFEGAETVNVEFTGGYCKEFREEWSDGKGILVKLVIDCQEFKNIQAIK